MNWRLSSCICNKIIINRYRQKKEVKERGSGLNGGLIYKALPQSELQKIFFLSGNIGNWEIIDCEMKVLFPIAYIHIQ